jgi:hypothetical protein
MKTYGVIRSLHEHGVRTLVASDAGWTPHVWSRYCDETVRLPDHTTDLTGYRDALLSLAAPRFDYLRRDDPRFVLGALRSFAGLDTRSKYQR